MGDVRSFHVTESQLEEEEGRDEVDEEIHRDQNVSIKVTQSPGYLCHIEATAAFRMPADKLFKQVITHPDNASIFRHMDRCSYRRVVSEEGGRRKVRVAHEASWRFLLWSGKFTTRLEVEEDDHALTMHFRLDPAGGRGGVMKQFKGSWHIRPHPKDPQHASLSTLDQDLALGVYMPPPFDRILKRISCNQVKKIFEDVQREAELVNRGKPTLCPWEEVKHKEIRVEAAVEGEEAAVEGAEELYTVEAAPEQQVAAAVADVTVEAAGGPKQQPMA